MWTTFLVALKANLRNRQALFWMIVFPIVLATMFNGFFGGLSEGIRAQTDTNGRRRR